MSTTQDLREWREEAYRIRLKLYFRAKRMRKFARLFRPKASTRIIDLGGTPFNWSLIGEKPEVTAVNINGETGRLGNVTMAVGDATRLAFPDDSFDVVFSNSVIEHVGPMPAMQAFAREVRRLAPSYYVQTPNKWFPVEPHCMGLFLHWFPMPVRRRLYRWVSIVGLSEQSSLADADEHLSGIHLLTLSELRQLFPDGTIIAERLWFWPFAPKSYVVVRHGEIARPAPA